jgi:hypothetical protein
MSDLYSAESADSTTDSNAPDSQPHGSANKTSSVPTGSAPSGPDAPSTRTSRNSEDATLNPSMPSAEDSPAKTSASPARGQDSTEPARVFGPSTHDLLASYDPATSSWRTSQLCLDGELDEFSGTWPRSGMTRSGIAYRRQPLAPLTGGTGSGLLPTPAARDWKDTGAPSEMNRKSPTLSARAWAGAIPPMLPTPAANPAGWRNIEVVDKDGNPPTHANQRWYDKKTGRVVQKDLRHVIERGMWPTPTAADGKGGPRTSPRPGRNAPQDLRSAVVWATPKASDADRGGRGDLLQQVNGNESPSGHFKTPTAVPFSHGGSGGELHKQVAPSGGPLNPQWVAWLMGFPIDWLTWQPSGTPSCPSSQSGSEGKS